jgi:uncharacterized protein (DUF924 family)
MDGDLVRELANRARFEETYGVRLGAQADRVAAVCEQTLGLLASAGAPPQRGGFLAVDTRTRQVVGSCAFKGAPDETGVVEIAYFTFPDFEGGGVARAMAAALLRRTAASSGVRRVRAHTLPEENASTRLLRRHGFAHLGTVVDPEDGPVWRWERDVPPDPESLLEFWFGDSMTSEAAARDRVGVWFVANDAFDALCRRFGDLPERAASGELDCWLGEARPALALVLAVDQLPRNLFRGTPRAFAFDLRAQSAATDAVASGFDASLHPLERSFLYLPFEHAEDLALQERSVALYEALERDAPAGLADVFTSFSDYARRHRDVIARFGRFPHRNAILQRAPTAAEAAWLEGGGERF